MSLVYFHFCDDCGRSSREAIEVCEWCGSHDISRAPAYAQVDYDDEVDNARLAEIRAQDAIVDQLIQQADELPERSADISTGTVPLLRMLERQAS